MLDFLRDKKISHLLKKYAEIGKFSYIQIVSKSTMLDVVLECIWDLFFQKDSMKVNMDLNLTVWRKQKNRIIQIGEFVVI